MQVLLEQWIIVIFPYDKAIEKIVILIVFKKYIRLNICIVKYYIIFLLLSSCSFFDYSVPEKEIIQSSSWSPNDQPPSYPECESLDLTDQKECFIQSIEKKLITYFNNRNISLQTSEYVLKVKIDTLGSFSIVKISSEVSLSDETKLQFNEAFKNLPKALPAVKTNVGEYVDVVFDLPIKLIVK
tara:strand:- start:2019 stop:2570 length:552 start_codon:yes stop_codon:yes gene_type:complete